MNNYAVPVTVLLVTVTLAAAFLPRHPWILARKNRKTERRILAQRAHPSVRIPGWFYQGQLPSHDMVRLSATEEIIFGQIAGAAEFGWLTRAIWAAREADQ